MSAGSVCFTDFECSSTLVCSRGVCTSPARSPRYIIGGITGIILVLVVLGICVCLCMRSRRAKQRREAEQRERERMFMQQQAYQQQPPSIAAYQADGVIYPQSPAPSNMAPFASPYPPPPAYASPQPSLVSPVASTPGGFSATPGPYSAGPASHNMPMAFELPSENNNLSANGAKEPNISTQPITELPADGRDGVSRIELDASPKKS